MGNGGSLSPQKAVERIMKLLDHGSFRELSGGHARGLITGCGLSEGRPVFVYGQDGPVSLLHAEKIRDIYDKAMTMGAPVIAVLDSAGMELAEGMETLGVYGKIFRTMSECSGVVPQICIVTGGCMGTAAFLPALSDFVIMCESNAALALTSPATINDPAAKTLSIGDFGGAKAHMNTGVAHFSAKTEDDAFRIAKDLIGYIPSNNLDDAPVGIMTGQTDELSDEADARGVMAHIADGGRFIEIRKDYGADMAVCFARVNGYTAGIIANGGCITADGAEKAAEHVRFCDAFNIPVIVINGSSGFAFAVQSHGDTLKKCAKLAYTFAQATVPLVNVITGEAAGGSMTVLNSKPLGADMAYAWTSAEISLLPAEGAKAVLGGEIDTSPLASVRAGFIDAVIEPAETRQAVVSALEMLNSKRVLRRAKKHGSI